MVPYQCPLGDLLSVSERRDNRQLSATLGPKTLRGPSRGGAGAAGAWSRSFLVSRLREGKTCREHPKMWPAEAVVQHLASFTSTDHIPRRGRRRQPSTMTDSLW
jgi:hypothetical protein